MNSKYIFAKYKNEELTVEILPNDILRIFYNYQGLNPIKNHKSELYNLIKLLEENKVVISNLNNNDLIIFNKDGLFEIEKIKPSEIQINISTDEKIEL